MNIHLFYASRVFLQLWNYRKEVFKKMEETKEEEEIQSLYSSELDFIDATLVSPWVARGGCTLWFRTAKI